MITVLLYLQHTNYEERDTCQTCKLIKRQFTKIAYGAGIPMDMLKTVHIPNEGENTLKYLQMEERKSENICSSQYQQLSPQVAHFRRCLLASNLDDEELQSLNECPTVFIPTEMEPFGSLRQHTPSAEKHPLNNIPSKQHPKLHGFIPDKLVESPGARDDALASMVENVNTPGTENRSKFLQKKEKSKGLHSPDHLKLPSQVMNKRSMPLASSHLDDGEFSFSDTEIVNSTCLSERKFKRKHQMTMADDERENANYPTRQHLQQINEEMSLSQEDLPLSLASMDIGWLSEYYHKNQNKNNSAYIESDLIHNNLISRSESSPNDTEGIPVSCMRAHSSSTDAEESQSKQFLQPKRTNTLKYKQKRGTNFSLQSTCSEYDHDGDKFQLPLEPSHYIDSRYYAYPIHSSHTGNHKRSSGRINNHSSMGMFQPIKYVHMQQQPHPPLYNEDSPISPLISTTLTVKQKPLPSQIKLSLPSADSSETLL